MQLIGSCCFVSRPMVRNIVFARSHRAFMEICDVVLRLLAASVVHSAILKTTGLAAWMNASFGVSDGALPSLKCLTLEKLSMDESHCRAWHLFETRSRDRAETLSITGAGASAGGGPGRKGTDEAISVKLTCAYSRMGYAEIVVWKIEQLLSQNFDVGNREFVRCRRPRRKEGLVSLHLLHGFTMGDRTWDAVCNSLKKHPTLQLLNIRSAPTQMLAAAVLESRIKHSWTC
jgi:hypothetical protein